MAPVDRVLDDLEMRIVAALQVDPRAPWRKIAAVLQEPERTIGRRGNELIEAELVNIVGIRLRAESALLRLQCAPGTARVTAESVAQRQDSTFSYIMTGGADCVAELLFDHGAMRNVLTTEVPATVGLVRALSYPILRYFRTIRRWTSEAITPEQIAALTNDFTPETAGMIPDDTLSGVDLRIANALAEDGRASLETIARRASTSETTAGRRLDWMLANSRVQIRALVEPGTLGLPVEAMLWISAAPQKVEHLGRLLATHRQVRYAVAVAGACHVVANVTFATNAELYDFITTSDWAQEAESIESTILLHARKRGGRLNHLAF